MKKFLLLLALSSCHNEDRIQKCKTNCERIGLVFSGVTTNMEGLVYHCLCGYEGEVWNPYENKGERREGSGGREKGLSQQEQGHQKSVSTVLQVQEASDVRSLCEPPRQ